MIGLFDRTDARRPGWEETVSRARARIADPHHYLAVIGEFSSGKSTFVNALLQAELFPSSALPATGAAVQVRHGPAFHVRAVFGDGSEWTVTGSVPDAVAGSGPLRPVRAPAGAGVPGTVLTPDEVRARLAGLAPRAALAVLSTDPSVAPSVRELRVRYPAPLLESGLVLIDTPGANAANEGPGPAHDRIAADAAARADAAVVVMSRAQVLAASLNDFLADALDEGVLAHSVFVVTRADEEDGEGEEDEDQAQARSRHDAVARVAALTGLTDPPVVLASPKEVLAVLRTGAAGDGAATVWVERFDRTRAWLLRTVEARRAAAVDDTVLRLVQSLQQGLEEGLTAEIRDLDRRRQELELVAPADMGGFLADQVTSHTTGLRAVERQVVAAVRAECGMHRAAAVASVTAATDACANGKELQQALSGPVPQQVRQCVDRFLENAAVTTRTHFDRRLTRLSAALFDDFGEVFGQLDRIDPAPLREHAPDTPPAPVSVTSGAFAAAGTLAADDSRRDRLSFGWGAGAGAAIGTMILPGVGTLVGGALGLFLGGMFTRDIAEVRGQAVQKATASVGELFDTAQRAAVTAVAETRAAACAEIDRQAEWYRTAYRKAVDVLHRSHADEQAALTARADRLGEAVGQVAGFAAHVAAERARLRVVGPLRPTDPFGGIHE
ncbi:dynamin family protein [Streptomyces sp. NPDC026659]|uniref:dynamin family protein n=1 Tax=Streptomyces sp. NPDC026659 TaxID=3155123 RepID=UPI00340CD2B9